jgi:hypothetical protein
LKLKLHLYINKVFLTPPKEAVKISAIMSKRPRWLRLTSFTVLTNKFTNKGLKAT